MAKVVSDYTNCTFFEILDREAVDVLGLIQIINTKNQYDNLK